MPEFKGLKVSQALPAASEYADIRHLNLIETENILTNSIGTIGSGGNGGFQSINLAVQLGVKRIILVGYDMNGDHWHGRHKAGLANPRPNNFIRWRKAIDRQAGILRDLGVEVFNANRDSALLAYPIVDLKDLFV